MDWKAKFPQENRYYEANKGILYCGDCGNILSAFPDNSVDAVITDPPYGLANITPKKVAETLRRWLNGEDDYVPKGKGFMGKDWDKFVPPPAIWREVYRVMKPGATILVFAGTRTYDLMTISLRLAGFEVKDTLMWVYGSGFPKGTDISKQIDKMFGAERKIIGKNPNHRTLKETYCMMGEPHTGNGYITAPATPEAQQWEGYNTALKPAYEPIIMAMKPNEGSYAQNALKWGVAGLNVDGTRISTTDNLDRPSGHIFFRTYWKKDFVGSPLGRFPANIMFDEAAAQMLDIISGKVGGGFGTENRAESKGCYGDFSGKTKGKIVGYGDSGSASRFFYVAKASSKERNMGLPPGKQNRHPTVKPIKLLQYLATLLKMPNEDQIYLDPFIGSGSTAIAIERLRRRWIGIELDPEYCEIASKRIEGNRTLL